MRGRRALAAGIAVAALLLIALGVWQLLARTAPSCGPQCDADTTYRGGILTLGGLAAGAVAALLWPPRPRDDETPTTRDPSAP
ncbi:MAG TPA: hypothetical protein VI796_06090 [Candidatus Thermoplasmatota archaeon]|nr:hypothetical protein [Candidatus Thermoplasmatota archaeon]